MSTSTFHRRDGQLWADQVPLMSIAEAVGTPTYVYSKAHFQARYQRLRAALEGVDNQLCYAVKANSNLSVLRCFAELGSGFDIVSGGELQRVLAAGGEAAKTIFSGVGKAHWEIDLALKHGIGCFNVESAAELERIIERAAALSIPAPISVRVNPNVDAQTHPYISTGLKNNKFGVPRSVAMEMYQRAAASAHCHVKGIDCHIGSQIETLGPMLESMDSLLDMVQELAAQGIDIAHVDLGGGMGVTYQDEQEFDVEAYGGAIAQSLRGFAPSGKNLQLMLEPGRFLVAGGGVLLGQVEYLKPAGAADGHHFAVVDAAMNDLIRPALYQAWHGVETVLDAPDTAVQQSWEIVGPICESGDFLAKDRNLALWPGAVVAFHSAGAYGFVQSSNYNSRGRAAEVLVDGDQFTVVRRRETVADQLASELEGLAAPSRNASGERA
ncbi:MAG: diaminopimelate decarboxylase [Pseudomonadales bacterium]